MPVIRPKTEQKEIAKQRISQLFAEAGKMFSSHPTLAHRYMTLARKMAMKTKVRIPLELKRRMCKYCHNYLQPGINARVRTAGGKVIISCFECKKFMRIPLKNSKKN